jgi:hypothetical protein
VRLPQLLLVLLPPQPDLLLLAFFCFFQCRLIGFTLLLLLKFLLKCVVFHQNFTLLQLKGDVLPQAGAHSTQTQQTGTADTQMRIVCAEEGTQPTKLLLLLVRERGCLAVPVLCWRD